MIMETYGMEANKDVIAQQLGRTLKNGIFVENVKTYLLKAGFVFVEKELGRGDQAWEALKIWQQIADDLGGHIAVEIFDKRDYKEVREMLAARGVHLDPLPPDEHALIIKGFGRDGKGEFVETFDPGYERPYRFSKREWMSMWFKMTDETRTDVIGSSPYLNEETGENVTWGWMMFILHYPEAPVEKEIVDPFERATIFSEVVQYLRRIDQPLPSEE